MTRMSELACVVHRDFVRVLESDKQSITGLGPAALAFPVAFSSSFGGRVVAAAFFNGEIISDERTVEAGHLDVVSLPVRCGCRRCLRAKCSNGHLCGRMRTRGGVGVLASESVSKCDT